MSSSAATPAPFRAEAKHTGIRCPSRSAFSKGACSCSGLTSPCSRYFSISASSTSTTWSTSAACASLTEEKSASPSGLKKQSTTSSPPFAGRLIGRHCFPTDCWILASIVSRSAFSASMRLITIMRQRLRFAAHLSMRSVASWIPVSAFTTITAVSTAASAPIACPMKSGEPGVSIRWMWTFFHAKLTSAELSECLYSFSSGSKSQTVLPFSTLPAVAIAPALASKASASVVLPAPVWPTSATVRMDSVEYLGMRTFLPDEPNGCAQYSTRAANGSSKRAASKPPAEAEHADREARQPVADPVRDALPQGLPEPAGLRHHAGSVLDVGAEPRTQPGGEAAILDHHVRLAREQQAERIDVGGAHGRPVAVDHRDLRVHEALLVLVDLDAGLEQHPVEGPRRVVQQQVLDPPLQQHHHAHAPRRGGGESAAKAPAGEKVGARDDDLLLRGGDRRQIGVLDIAAVAQVVAHGERRALASRARHVRRHRVADARAVLEPRHRDAVPQAHRGVLDRLEQRPLDPHRVVVARRDLPQGVHVVDDVDAADEGDAPVRHHDLAVHAPQAVAPQGKAPDLRAEHQEARPRVAQIARELRRHVPRAEAVHEHVHRRPAPRGRAQSLRDALPGGVAGVDVGLEEDLALRFAERGLERGEILDARAQQRQPVSGQELDRHAGDLLELQMRGKGG